MHVQSPGRPGSVKPSHFSFHARNLHETARVETPGSDSIAGDALEKMEKLTPLSKVMIVAIVAGAGVTAYRTYSPYLPSVTPEPRANAMPSAAPSAAAGAPAAKIPKKAGEPFPKRPVRVALS